MASGGMDAHVFNDFKKREVYREEVNTCGSLHGSLCKNLSPTTNELKRGRSAIRLTISCSFLISLKRYSKLLGMTPRSSCWKLSVSSCGPSIVKVFPDPVCPLYIQKQTVKQYCNESQFPAECWVNIYAFLVNHRLRTIIFLDLILNLLSI